MDNLNVTITVEIKPDLGYVPLDKRGVARLELTLPEPIFIRVCELLVNDDLVGAALADYHEKNKPDDEPDEARGG